MNYRIVNSINESAPESIRAAFARRGISDYCNALAGRARSQHVQVFIMDSGQVVPADSRILAEVSRATHGV